MGSIYVNTYLLSFGKYIMENIRVMVQMNLAGGLCGRLKILIFDTDNQGNVLVYFGKIHMYFNK